MTKYLGKLNYFFYDISKRFIRKKLTQIETTILYLKNYLRGYCKLWHVLVVIIVVYKIFHKKKKNIIQLNNNVCLVLHQETITYKTCTYVKKNKLYKQKNEDHWRKFISKTEKNSFDEEHKARKTNTLSCEGKFS